MSLFQSKRLDLRGYISKSSIVEFSALFTLLSVLLCIDNGIIPQYVLIVVSLIYVNLYVAYRYVIKYYINIQLLLAAILLYTVLGAFDLPVSDFTVDLLLILSFIILYVYQLYPYEYPPFTREYIPFTMLTAVALGIYLDIDGVLRYILLTIWDTLTSSVVSRERKSLLYKYVVSYTLFLVAYSSPLVNPGLVALFTFSSLHLLRNLFQLGLIKKYVNTASHILAVDILMKPVVLVIS